MRELPKDRAAARQPAGLPWTCVEEGTRRHHPGPSHSPPLLETGRTSAEDWAGRPPASSVPALRRSPIVRALGRRGCALFVSENSSFFSLQKCESVHQTTCQARFLSCRSAPSLPLCSPSSTPLTRHAPFRLEDITHARQPTMLQIPKASIHSSPKDRTDGEGLQTASQSSLPQGWKVRQPNLGVNFCSYDPAVRSRAPTSEI